MIKLFLSFIYHLGDIGNFFLKTLYWGVRPPYHLRESVRIMSDLGWRCLLPVLFVVGPMGAAVSLQGIKLLTMFGTESLLSSMLSVAILREISPVMASMMVASQAGSSISAELGAMRVKEEIDALEVMAVNPIQRLVVPRLLAGLVVAPLLNAVASFVGLAGGYLVAVPLKGMNTGIFMENLFAMVTTEDLSIGLFKTAIFGLTITTIACYQGFHVTGGAEGVGRATNRTVVYSAVVVLLFNYILSSFFYGSVLG